MVIEGKKETLVRIGYNVSYLQDKEGRNYEKECLVLFDKIFSVVHPCGIYRMGL